MKVIELLTKIANGEEVPKKIKVGNIIWSIDKKEKTYFMNNTNIQLFYVEKITKRLNDEVEIIEEDKKIEKLDIYNCFEQLGDSLLAKERLDYNFNAISDKINEIINKINEEK